MIKFDILNRFTGAIQFTAEIDCTEDALQSVKVGLAVKWAVKTKADLSRANLSGADLSGADLSEADLSEADLSRANLSGADLSEADLSEADLSEADLSGANLSGANLSGADIRVIGGRSDGYIFILHKHPDGALYLRAGCRYFTLAEAREHWTRTRAGTPLGDESMALIAHAEVMARIAGWLPAHG